MNYSDSNSGNFCVSVDTKSTEIFRVSNGLDIVLDCKEVYDPYASKRFQPKIDWQLLESKDIHIFGKRISFVK